MDAIACIFTAPKLFKLWPQTTSHTRWPDTELIGDRVFDAYYASTTPVEGNNTSSWGYMRD